MKYLLLFFLLLAPCACATTNKSQQGKPQPYFLVDTKTHQVHKVYLFDYDQQLWDKLNQKKQKTYVA